MDAQQRDFSVYYRALAEVYEQALPFNRLVGMRDIVLSDDEARLSLDMRADLVGNPFKGSLHGGVIAAALDVVGGLAASIGLIHLLADLDVEQMKQRFVAMGTIDLRVDYLLPGRGLRFTARGFNLRTGHRVSHTRMELANDEGLLIAAGVGTYLVG